MGYLKCEQRHLTGRPAWQNDSGSKTISFDPSVEHQFYVKTLYPVSFYKLLKETVRQHTRFFKSIDTVLFASLYFISCSSRGKLVFTQYHTVTLILVLNFFLIKIFLKACMINTSEANTPMETTAFVSFF